MIWAQANPVLLEHIGLFFLEPFEFRRKKPERSATWDQRNK